MADVISAQEGALKRGAEAVETAKTGIDSEMKRVKGEIQDVAGVWSGPAAVQFQALLNRWDEETRKINNVLVTLQDALRGTESDLQANEDQTSSTISGLTAMMN